MAFKIPDAKLSWTYNGNKKGKQHSFKKKLSKLLIFFFLCLKTDCFDHGGKNEREIDAAEDAGSNKPLRTFRQLRHILARLFWDSTSWPVNCNSRWSVRGKCLQTSTPNRWWWELVEVFRHHEVGSYKAGKRGWTKRGERQESIRSADQGSCKFREACCQPWQRNWMIKSRWPEQKSVAI